MPSSQAIPSNCQGTYRTNQVNIMTKFKSLQSDFEKAILRLAEVLKEIKTDIVRDSAIKRFEITFDLSWKAVKAFLEEYHI